MRKSRQIIKIGALTSKPYSFKSRSWELKDLESIDLNDSLNSNIKLHYKNSQILRILPNINENINEEWITDKVRFSYDSLNRWRFNTPLILNENKFISSSWNEAFLFIKNFVANNPKHVTKIFGGNYNSLESLLAMKLLSYDIKPVQITLTTNKNPFNNDIINNNLLNINTRKKQIFVFIGTNLRIENPILNLRFRKLSKKNKILIGYIGASYNSTSYMYHLGSNIKKILDLINGKNKFCFLIKKFSVNLKFPLTFILGLDYQNRFDSHYLQKLLNKFSYNSLFSNTKISLLREFSSEINADLLNLNNNIKINNNQSSIVYLIGSDFMNCNKNTKNDLTIFIGHHNDTLRKIINVILPTYTPFESNGLHLNILNILQKANGLSSIFKHTREEFLILLMINKYVYLNKHAFNNQKSLVKYLYKVIGIKTLNKPSKIKYYCVDDKFLFINNIAYYSAFKNNKTNFYLSDSFTRASKNMQECSKSFFFNKNSYIWN